jgi:hypothetical protein
MNLGKFRNPGIALLAGLVGGIAGRLTAPERTVHAQENYSGLASCITAVPKSWGEFRGGSEYGLAFEDEKGVLRFALHPGCGSADSRGLPPAAPMDLEIQRR